MFAVEVRQGALSSDVEVREGTLRPDVAVFAAQVRQGTLDMAACG